MAAHAYAVLKEVAEGKEDPRLFRHALGHTLFGDQIGLWRHQDWVALNKACELGAEELGDVARYILPFYEERWNRLGQPRNAEDWDAEVHRLWKAGEDIL